MKRQYDQNNYQMTKLDQIVRELRARESDLQEALGAKDSQLAILRVRFDESDKELIVSTRYVESIYRCLIYISEIEVDLQIVYTYHFNSGKEEATRKCSV